MFSYPEPYGYTHGDDGYAVIDFETTGMSPAQGDRATEIAAVITYTKNHWSNKTGQVVQPADVKTARK